MPSPQSVLQNSLGSPSMALARFRTLFRALNGCLLAFALPFFLWHGNGGSRNAQFDLKTITWMQKMCRSSFLCDLQANLAHLGRSVSAAFLCFITRYCKNAPKKPCSIRYAKMNNLDRNELRRRPNPCIIRFLHYSFCIIEISTVSHKSFESRSIDGIEAGRSGKV